MKIRKVALQTIENRHFWSGNRSPCGAFRDPKTVSEQFFQDRIRNPKRRLDGNAEPLRDWLRFWILIRFESCPCEFWYIILFHSAKRAKPLFRFSGGQRTKNVSKRIDSGLFRSERRQNHAFFACFKHQIEGSDRCLERKNPLLVTECFIDDARLKGIFYDIERNFWLCCRFMLQAS